MDSTVPHKAQLLGWTDMRPGSAGRASSCFGESPPGNQPLTAPTPIRLAIITEAAGPAMSGWIRIYPDLSALALVSCFSRRRFAPDSQA
jgi:hypothetical protein